MRRLGSIVAAIALSIGSVYGQTSMTSELAPTGKLRVAIAVGPAPSALWTIRDAATGKARGVPVELGTALAQKLGVPVEMVEFTASGEIVAAADHDRWDVTFVPVDDDRRKVVDFGAPYHLLQSTYLVAPRGWTQWVKNALASGHVRLVRGRSVQEFAVRLVPASERPPLLKDYLERYRGAVQRYFEVPAGAKVEAFVPVADGYPVLELVPAGESAGAAAARS